VATDKAHMQLHTLWKCLINGTNHRHCNLYKVIYSLRNSNNSNDLSVHEDDSSIADLLKLNLCATWYSMLCRCLGSSCSDPFICWLCHNCIRFVML